MGISINHMVVKMFLYDVLILPEADVYLLLVQAVQVLNNSIEVIKNL